MRNGDTIIIDTNKISMLGSVTNEKLQRNTVLICDGVMLNINPVDSFEHIEGQLEFNFKERTK